MDLKYGPHRIFGAIFLLIGRENSHRWEEIQREFAPLMTKVKSVHVCVACLRYFDEFRKWLKDPVGLVYAHNRSEQCEEWEGREGCASMADFDRTCHQTSCIGHNMLVSFSKSILERRLKWNQSRRSAERRRNEGWRNDEWIVAFTNIQNRFQNTFPTLFQTRMLSFSFN